MALGSLLFVCRSPTCGLECTFGAFHTLAACLGAVQVENFDFSRVSFAEPVAEGDDFEDAFYPAAHLRL